MPEPTGTYRRGPKSPTKGKHGDSAKRVPMTDPFWKGNPRKVKALDLLLSGKLPQHVATELGVHHTTVYSWMKQDAFAAELKDAQDAAIQTARTRIAASAADLADHLVDLAKTATKQQFAQVTATTEALAIAGVVAPKTVDVTVSGDLDRLTDEQLEALVLAKAEELKRRG